MTDAPGRLRPAPWGWSRVVAAIVAALLVHFALLFTIPVVAEAMGYEPSFRDAGDTFEMAGEVAVYTDERIAAIAGGMELPELPQLRGDLQTARIAYLAAIVDLVLIAGITVVAAGRGPRRFFRDVGLHRSPLEDISRPIIAAAITIVALGVFVAVMRTAGLEDVVAESAAPETVLRDNLALVLFGFATVICAPVAEELLFRGLLFGRLLAVGAPVAIVASSLVFAAWHVSPSVIPLLVVGGVLAWLYLRSATLWQPIIFHGIFNLVSFVQFVGNR